jgi:hypothetical protein
MPVLLSINFYLLQRTSAIVGVIICSAALAVDAASEVVLLYTVVDDSQPVILMNLIAKS